ncbi:MAG: hypothetical protein JJU08_03945 [Rhodobacteraceae bacterium]|nr:hypothetical protein [Paracoccaceae bacterium]
MFRFFDLLGRSSAMNALDDAFRAFGVHPMLVPDPVKLTVMQLYKTQVAALGRKAAFAQAAQLLAYCILGHEQFASNNGTDIADQTEHRVDEAITDGTSRDAKLILLAVHSGLISPEIADLVDVDDD